MLTVCTANVCRSPAAAVMLKSALAKLDLSDLVEVESAGTTYESEGFPMDDRIELSLKRAGYEPEHHAARTVVVHELNSWDLVLTMTDQHLHTMERKLSTLKERVPSLHMWGEFDPKKPANASLEQLNVPDPWYENQKFFDKTVRKMERSVPSIIHYIKQRLKEMQAL